MQRRTRPLSASLLLAMPMALGGTYLVNAAPTPPTPALAPDVITAC